MDLLVLIVPIATAFIVGYRLGASQWRRRMRKSGKDPVELDVSVLKFQRGDTVVLRCHEHVTKEMADRIKGDFSSTFEDMGVKAMVLDKTVSIEGVLRG
jgi:hypothetical protein